MRRVDTATIIAHLVFSTVHFQMSESYREHTDAIITHKLKLHNSQTDGDTFCCFGGSILSLRSSRDESISVVWQDGSHQNPLHLEYWENNAFSPFQLLLFLIWYKDNFSALNGWNTFSFLVAAPFWLNYSAKAHSSLHTADNFLITITHCCIVFWSVITNAMSPPYCVCLDQSGKTCGNAVRPISPIPRMDKWLNVRPVWDKLS